MTLTQDALAEALARLPAAAARRRRRYWGYPSDRWHLDFDRGARLADPLAGLAQILPSELGWGRLGLLPRAIYAPFPRRAG